MSKEHTIKPTRFLRYGPSKSGKTFLFNSWGQIINPEEGEWVLIINTEEGMAALTSPGHLPENFYSATFMDMEAREKAARTRRRAGSFTTLSSFLLKLQAGEVLDLLDQELENPTLQPRPRVVCLDTLTGLTSIIMNEALQAGNLGPNNNPDLPHWQSTMSGITDSIVDLWWGAVAPQNYWYLDVVGHEMFIMGTKEDNQGRKTREREILDIRIDAPGEKRPDFIQRHFDGIFYHQTKGPKFGVQTQPTSVLQIVGTRGNMNMETGKPLLNAWEDITYQPRGRWGWGKMFPKLGL